MTGNSAETDLKPKRTRKDHRALTPRQKRRIENLYAAGHSLPQIAKRLGKSLASVGRYVAAGGENGERLARARKVHAHLLIDEAREIIDNVEPEQGHVSKAREQVGLRKHIAACLDRPVWGERQTIDLAVTTDVRAAIGGPLVGTARVVQPLLPEVSTREPATTEDDT